MIAGYILRFEMDFGDATVIAGGQAIKDFGQPLPRTPVDAPHDAEIDRHDRAIGSHEQIALVHVGMEIAAADGLRQECQNQPLRQSLAVVACGIERCDITDLDAVDPVEGHHPAIGAIPIDFGHAIPGKSMHLFGQFRCGCRFAPQIEFAHGPAAQIGDNHSGAQTACFAAQPFEMRRGPFIGRDIARKPFAHAGPQHFDCHLATVGGCGAMHLRN